MIPRTSILCLWATVAFGQLRPTVPQPTNIEFGQGEIGKLPPGWNMPQFVLNGGYRAERRQQGCGPHLSICVAYVAPPIIGTVRAAEIQQTFPADSFIGKSIRFSALLRMQAADATGYVHIRMRVDYKGKVDMRDSVAPPVRSVDWQYREVLGHVNPGAVSISIWARYVPSGSAWVAAPSFGVIDDNISTTVNSEEAPIYAIMTIFSSARNAHNSAYIASLYSEDGEFRSSNGDHATIGRLALEKLWSGVQGQVVRTVQSVNFSGTDLAIVHVSTLFPDIGRTREVFIVVKEQLRWNIWVQHPLS